MLDRRRLLRIGAAATLMGTFGKLGSAHASSSPAPQAVISGARRLSFSNLHTGEKLSLAFWNNGSYDPAALGEINKLLRDYRTGEVHSIDPKLLDLLHDINSRL